MDDKELLEQFTAEIVDLEQSGAGLPFVFKPSEAFYLLALLQLALRHPFVDTDTPGAAQFGEQLARNIESRLCKTPAMAEVARRGWEQQEHDGHDRGNT
jgi:hypothetical protein